MKMHCKGCGYETTVRANWQRHLNSNKHKSKTRHACACGQVFSRIDNLHRHEKNCRVESPSAILLRAAKEQAERDETSARDQKAREDRLMAEINALKSQIASLPAPVHATFNMNFFLNDTCKNAQTLHDFMNSIPIRFEPDQTMGQIILANLERCSVEERPIHCTDLKRGKLAVRHSDKTWEQDPKKVDPIIATGVNVLRNRFARELTDVWCAKHPDYLTNDRRTEEWAGYAAMASRGMDETFKVQVAKVTTIPKECV